MCLNNKIIAFLKAEIALSEKDLDTQLNEYRFCREVVAETTRSINTLKEYYEDANVFDEDIHALIKMKGEAERTLRGLDDKSTLYSKIRILENMRTDLSNIQFKQKKEYDNDD